MSASSAAQMRDSGVERSIDAREDDSAKRRQILEGARRVFLARGFEGASMGDIAKAAGVSKGTLYVYFASKDALFEALTREERSSVAEALFRLDHDDPDLKSVLTQLGCDFLDLLAAPEHISAVRMVIGAADRFPEFAQAHYQAGPRFGAERLAAYLDRHVAAGRLAIDDTPMAAEQFMNLCAAGVLKRLLFAVTNELDSDSKRRNVESAVRVFLAAYGTRA